MSVRLRLFLLVLCVVVPCVAAMGWAITSAYQGEKESVEQSLRETTRAMATVVGGEVGVREAVARTLASSDVMASGDYAAFHRMASGAMKDLGGGWVVLLDAERMLVNTLVPHGTPLPMRTADPSRRKVQTDGGVTDVSPLFTGGMAGEPVTAVTVPASGGSGRAYQISVTVPPATLLRVIEAQRLPAGWIAAVIDQNGMVIARHPDHARWIGMPATSDMQARIRAHGEGDFRSVSLDGRMTAAFFNRVPGRPWTFVIAIPEDQLRSSARAAVTQVSAATLLMLALAGLAALAASRRIAESARQLQRTARALQSDQEVYYRPAGVAELDAAGIALVHAAEQLRSANRMLSEEVEAAVQQTRIAQEQAATHQRLEALGRLTGGVAHDVNNLLAVVSNNAALLKTLPATAPRDAPLAAIARSVQAGRALTQKLLSFARQRTQAATRVDLHEWLPALQSMLRTSVPSQVWLEVTVAPGTAALRVDVAELELALLNLAVNAGHAMPGGGRLTIHAANALPDGASKLPMIAITVRDTGSGIGADVLPRVFEPFFTTKDKAGGSGLGLSQVYGFCTQAGGSVSVASVPGEGAAFTLLLPADGDVEPSGADATEPRPLGAPGPSEAADAADAAAAADAGVAAAPVAAVPAPGADPAEPAQPRARLLYVEDNVDLAESTRALLRAGNYAVHWAADGEQALAALAREAEFDVVLSDYVMPGSVNGLQLGVHVRATRPRLPFVLLTGYAEQAAEAVAAGFIVLHKPCGADELAAVLNRLTAPVP